jgi:hypothetical protein
MMILGLPEDGRDQGYNFLRSKGEHDIMGGSKLFALALFIAFLSVLLGVSKVSPYRVSEERQSSPEMRGQILVHQVDHILISSDEPERLFRLFSQELGLPVVWPFRSYGVFSSGGVSFGNVNIELIRSERNQSGLTGVALEPTSLNEVLNRLDALGLKHGEPVPFYQKDASGARRLLWTTVDVPTLPPAGTIFFCKYSLNVDDRRSRVSGELRTHDGGPLGIESVRELVIGANDMATARHDWTVLLGPSRPDKEALWQSGSGPEIRLVSTKKDRLVQLRVKVQSLQRARVFLKSENLLGIDDPHEISIDPAHLAGADIRLVE